MRLSFDRLLLPLNVALAVAIYAAVALGVWGAWSAAWGQENHSEQPRCYTVEETFAIRDANYPMFEERLHLTGAEAAAFIEWFNALPPASLIIADEVIALNDPRYPDPRGIDKVLFFYDGCFVWWSTLDPRLTDRFAPGAS